MRIKRDYALESEVLRGRIIGSAALPDILHLQSGRFVLARTIARLRKVSACALAKQKIARANSRIGT